MPHLNLTMTKAGPIVELWAGVSPPREQALIKAGQAVPSLMKIRGLIDTGASCSAIDPSIIRQLQIPVRGTASIHTPSSGSSAHVCNQYDLMLLMPDANGNLLYKGHSVAVLEATLTNQGIEALVGRDILSKAILIYDGAAGAFTISY